jgi:hypothetical protein
VSRRDKGETHHDPRIADVLPFAALYEHVAIVGTSRAGKTCAARGWVERRLEAGVRVCIVDPLEAWWGSRAGAHEVLDLRDHVENLAVADLPKGFGR